MKAPLLVLVLPVLAAAPGASCAGASGAKRATAHSAGVAMPETDPAPLFSVELVLIAMPDADVDRLLGSGAAQGAVRPTTLLPEIDALARGRPDVQFVNSQRLVLHEGAMGEMTVVSEESYLEDFDVDAEMGIADPVIGTLQEGFWFEVRPSLADDAASVDLDFTLRSSEILRPIREADLTIPNSTASVKIQVPESRSTTTSRRITVGHGECFAFRLDWDAEEASPRRATLVILSAGTL